MTMVKRIITWILSIAVLLLVAAIGTYLLIDDATLASQLTKRIEAASGTQITYRQDASITRTWAPLFTLNDLVIEDIDGRFAVATSLLQLQLSLPALLLGRLDVPRLVLGGTTLEINESDDSGKETISNGLPLVPTFHDVQISRLSVNYHNEEIVWSGIQLEELAARTDSRSGKLVLTVRPVVAGRRVHLVVTLPGMDEILTIQRLPFSLAAEESASRLTVDGLVNLQASPATVDAQVRAVVNDVEEALTGVAGVASQGEISVEALVTGNFEQLAMEKISATWKGPRQSHAR